MALHNWLKEVQANQEDDDPPLVPPQGNPGGDVPTPEAMRDKLADYFMSEEGEIAHQWGIVHQTSN